MVTGMSVNSCAASFPLGLEWVGACDSPLSFSLSVHIHSALCASPSPAPDSVGFLSEQKCFNSVCDFKSLGVVHGLWDEASSWQAVWETAGLFPSALWTQ